MSVELQLRAKHKRVSRRPKLLTPAVTARVVQVLRCDVNLPTQVLARFMGCSCRTIQRLFSGRQRQIGHAKVLRLATRLRWPIERLTGDDDALNEAVLTGWLYQPVAADAERAACALAVAISTYARVTFSMACDYMIHTSDITGRPVRVTIVLKPFSAAPYSLVISEDSAAHYLQFAGVVVQGAAYLSDTQFRLTRANLHNALNGIAKTAELARRSRNQNANNHS